MDTVLFFAYAGAYAGLLAWGLVLASRNGWWTPANLPLLVVIGLLYDNTVLATGRFIGQGPALEALSLPRYWLHALLTPLLVAFAWHVVARSGARWARSRAAAVAAALFAAALVVLELVTVVAGLSLSAQREYGVLSYSDAASGGGPPLMVLFVSAALVTAAFIVWRRQGWVWFLVGSGLMVVGSAVPLPLDSGAATNAFELVLLTSIIATKHFQDRAGSTSTSPAPR